MLLQCLRKTVATFHARADVFDDVFHDFVGRLLGQRLERLHHGQTGIDHRGQLACKYNQVNQCDRAASGLSLSRDLLLNRQDAAEALEVQPSFEAAPDFATSPRFPRYVTERGHIF